ncbi:glycoside hydrolase family 3 protein [bacterium]|nr:glycoside hydrolase family 3 protein [bacterium]
MKRGVFIVLGIISALNLWGQQFPYQNPALSSEERAKDLISRLTLTEKATLMCDVSEAIPRLGIKKFNWWSEALHGLANNENVTVFPQPVGMAASFDDELVYTIFDAVSDETRARYNEEKQKGGENKRFLSLSVWTPNINIFRDPRWGRGQETYGEDPYLTSRMGVSVVKGLQGPSDAKYRKLLACAKHFAVHSGPEWSRHSLNVVNVDPQYLYETYLPAFKALVREADVRQVMCAYQRLEDEPCCGNTRLLQRILRDDWGYKYLVVSDCDAIADFYNGHKFSSDATHAVAQSIPAGTDVECAWQYYNYMKLPDAVTLDLIREEDMDKSLMRVLVGRFDLGEMDDDDLVPWTKIPASVINNEEHRKLALDMARESMTLLQNKNNILPLKKSGKRIAVIGPNADNERVLWGNYNGTPIRTITVLDGIASKLPANKILYEEACHIVDNKVLESFADECSIGGREGFRATYWNNSDMTGDMAASQQLEGPLKLASEGKHELAPGVKLEGFSAKYETEFTAPETGEIVFKYGAQGAFELLVNDKPVVKFEDWRKLISKTPYKVEAGKKYKIEIRFTQLYTWQAAIEFDFGRETDQDYSGLIARLKGIDVVVFVGGLSNLLEGEEMPVSYPGFKGGDRTDIELPAVQRNCIKMLKEAGKKVILVNCSGSALGLVPETENCEAILQAWYAGESGGQAVADVLFGDYNPSGKLPVTFYKSIDQLPDFEDYSMNGRTYRYMSDPLFPFGFGLSYTTFSVGTAQILKNEINSGGSIELTVPVTNTGKRDGTEIVQVYIRKAADSEGPLKTLRGFRRVAIAAGETGVATIDLPHTSFEFFDRASGKMEVIPGEYEVLYGTSSDAKDLKIVNIMIQ